MKRINAALKAIAGFFVLFALLVGCSYLNAPVEPEAREIVPYSTVVNGTLAMDGVPPSESILPTSTAMPGDTPEPPPCIKWDRITIEMVGQEVCVYGVAFSLQGQSRIDFSPEKNSFFLVDREYFYPELTEGSCVVAKKKVEVYDDSIPFMTIQADLYKCEPWMLE